MRKEFFIGSLLQLALLSTYGQGHIADHSNPTLPIIPGAEYQANGLHEKLWGHGYREEWTHDASLSLQVIHSTSAWEKLSRLYRYNPEGSVEIETAGDPSLLRPVDKTYCLKLPPLAEGTFLASLAHDGTASFHPYSTLILPELASAAGVGFVPSHLVLVQPSAGHDRQDSAVLCIEQRFHDFHPLSSTVVEKALLPAADTRIDQASYLKLRLFMMLTGITGNDEQTMVWKVEERNHSRICTPLLLKMDGGLADFEGLFTGVFTKALNLYQLQPFRATIASTESFNLAYLNQDRHFLNELSKEDWVRAARSLQSDLTDQILEKALSKVPAAVSHYHNQQLLYLLQQRRDNLVTIALAYYRVTAKYVDIPGTVHHERFKADRHADGKTQITVTGRQPYQRLFDPEETKEVRLYGVKGPDDFLVNGKARKAIRLRVVGSPQSDTLTDRSAINGLNKSTQYYDTPGNHLAVSSETSVHLTQDTAINHYDPNEFYPDSKGIVPQAGYETLYEFYAGLGYEIKKYHWRKKPFGWDQLAAFRYSLTEESLSVFYNGLFTHMIGPWNIELDGGYDMIRDVNYFGIGNTSVLHTHQWRYYYLLSRDLYLRAGLDRLIDSVHHLKALMVFDRIRIVDQQDRYISSTYEQASPDVFQWKNFGGVEGSYEFTRVDDPSFVTRGAHALADIQWLQNLEQPGRTLTNYQVGGGVYVPVANQLSLVVKAGGATLTGTPEFYQLNNIGGIYNLRGFRHYRFYGRTVAYNQNEVRWTHNVRSYIMNGKWGILAFFDDGRVWQPHEQSRLWHTGAGGGFMIEPFNKFSFVLTYSRSKEDRVFDVHLGKYF